MQTLHALDLTELTGTDSLWRRRRDSDSEPRQSHPGAASVPGLPVDGFSSPLGFWFAEAPSWKTVAPRLRVEFFELNDLERANRPQDEPPRLGTPTCRAVRARLKAPGGRARARRSTLPLILEIDSNVARIGVDADTWSNVGETVLFAVAQYWRLAAIDRDLDELSTWARNDLEKNSGFASLIRRRRSSELRAHRGTLQGIILDLPDFEGSLTNPRGHLANGPAVHLYRRLCAWLGLNHRRREIDERVEVVESIFDSLTESLNHFQSLAFQIVLEMIIVALLVLDVGFYILDAVFLK